MQLEQWAAQYNMNAAQFRESTKQYDAEYQMKVAQILEDQRQWQASYDMQRANFLQSQYEFSEQMGWDQQKWKDQQDQWAKEFGLSRDQFQWQKDKYEQGNLTDMGMALLQAGIMPSESQLAAMGLTKSQAQSYIAALQLALSAGGDGSNNNPGSDRRSKDLQKDETPSDDAADGSGSDFVRSIAGTLSGVTANALDKVMNNPGRYDIPGNPLGQVIRGIQTGANNVASGLNNALSGKGKTGNGKTGGSTAVNKGTVSVGGKKYSFAQAVAALRSGNLSASDRAALAREMRYKWNYQLTQSDSNIGRGYVGGNNSGMRM
jgi:hypothetical protein